MHVHCIVKGEWVRGRIIGVNVGDKGKFPYQLELEDGREILIPADGPAHVRLDKPHPAERLQSTAPPFGFQEGGVAEGGFHECEIQDRSGPGS